MSRHGWQLDDDDLAGPAPRAELEARIEARAVRWARRRGWIVLKQGGAYNPTGYPDRLFLKNGIYIWIEFKRPGEVPTKLQAQRHTELRAQGAAVYVCDNSDDAIARLRAAEMRNEPWPDTQGL